MKIAKMVVDSKGKTSTWFIILVLLAAFVVAFKIGKLYFDNATLKSEVEEISERYLLEEDYDLIGNLIKTASHYDIQLKPKDIHHTVNSNRSQIDLSFTYKRPVDLYVLHPEFGLSIEVTKEMAKARNILDNFKTDVEAGSNGASQRYLNDVEKKLGR